jgi:hypothetical protein
MPGPRLSIKGSAGLGIAAVVVVILYFWHKLRPIRPEDFDDKRPLKLKLKSALDYKPNFHPCSSV